MSSCWEHLQERSHGEAGSQSEKGPGLLSNNTSIARFSGELHQVLPRVPPQVTQSPPMAPTLKGPTICPILHCGPSLHLLNLWRRNPIQTITSVLNLASQIAATSSLKVAKEKVLAGWGGAQ